MKEEFEKKLKSFRDELDYSIRQSEAEIAEIKANIDQIELEFEKYEQEYDKAKFNKCKDVQEKYQIIPR